MFDEQAIVLREICNGIMFLSACTLIGIFTHYIWAGASKNRLWYKDSSNHAAAAIVILMAGHATRAFSSWMEFLFADLGWDNSLWINSLYLFTIATALIISAKLLMVYTFAPTRWRALLTWTALAASVGIPGLLALIAAYVLKGS